MALILIAGMPGAGKTSLGSRLSTDLAIPMLSKDSFKEILFDTVGFRSRAEKNALGVAATEAMYYAAKAILLRGGSVIIENNFDHACKPGMLRLLAQTGAAPVTVLVDCAFPVLYERYVRRDLSPERHRGHVINTAYPEPEGPKPPPSPLPYETSREEMRSFMEVRGFRSFDVGGERIVADTTDFESFDYDALLATVREKINEAEG